MPTKRALPVTGYAQYLLLLLVIPWLAIAAELPSVLEQPSSPLATPPAGTMTPPDTIPGDARTSAVGAPAQPLQFKQSEFDLGATISEMVMYLALLCAVAALLIYLLRQRMISSGSLPDKLGSHIRVKDRKALSTRTTLHLVDVDGRQVLLSESAQGHSMLELYGSNSSTTKTGGPPG